MEDFAVMAPRGYLNDASQLKIYFSSAESYNDLHELTKLSNPWCNLVNTKCRHTNDLDFHNRSSPIQDKLVHKAKTTM
jgi:hypothetical protein